MYLYVPISYMKFYFDRVYVFIVKITKICMGIPLKGHRRKCVQIFACSIFNHVRFKEQGRVFKSTWIILTTRHETLIFNKIHLHLFVIAGTKSMARLQ